MQPWCSSRRPVVLARSNQAIRYKRVKQFENDDGIVKCAMCTLMVILTSSSLGANDFLNSFASNKRQQRLLLAFLRRATFPWLYDIKYVKNKIKTKKQQSGRLSVWACVYNESGCCYLLVGCCCRQRRQSVILIITTNSTNAKTCCKMAVMSSAVHAKFHLPHPL